MGNRNFIHPHLYTFNRKGTQGMLQDTGERIIPPIDGEVSYLFNRPKMVYLFANSFTKQNVVLDAGCGNRLWL